MSFHLTLNFAISLQIFFANGGAYKEDRKINRWIERLIYLLNEECENISLKKAL